MEIFVTKLTLICCIILRLLWFLSVYFTFKQSLWLNKFPYAFLEKEINHHCVVLTAFLFKQFLGRPLNVHNKYYTKIILEYVMYFS